MTCGADFPCRGVRALRVNPRCQAGGEFSILFESNVALGPVLSSRTLSCLLANWFAECTEESHPSQRKASSAEQYHRARFRKHPSQALAVLPATAFAAFFVVIMESKIEIYSTGMSKLKDIKSGQKFEIEEE